MRLWNIADREIKGCLIFHRRLAEAVETNLNEEEGEKLEVVNGMQVPLRVRGCELKTIKLIVVGGVPPQNSLSLPRVGSYCP